VVEADEEDDEEALRIPALSAGGGPRCWTGP